MPEGKTGAAETAGSVPPATLGGCILTKLQRQRQCKREGASRPPQGMGILRWMNYKSLKKGSINQGLSKTEGAVYRPAPKSSRAVWFTNAGRKNKETRQVQKNLFEGLTLMK